MSCCGQRRQAWREYAREPQPAPQAPMVQNSRRLYYAGETSLAMKGPVTGYSYLFAGGQEGLPVDGRDVAALLETKLFTA